MKKIKFILILIAAALLSHAQELEYAKNIIKQLASPEFKGRGYVGKGDKIAAKYIAKQYQVFGLQPLNKKSYFQKFNISVNTLPQRVSVKIDGNELKAAVDYLVAPSSPSIKGRFQIITTNRNLIDTEEKLASTVKKAHGSFLLIDSRNKKDEDKELSKKIDENLRILQQNPASGIKGIIILTDEKLMWRGSTRQNPIPVVTIKKELDLNTVNTIEIVVDARFIPAYETQNVAGVIPGTSDTDSMIVILAHYDHLGKMGKNVYFPGANDNASGVSMLLSMAKHYSEDRPKYNIVFIVLSAEEIGILGAKAFVANPLIDLNKIKFLVNFDMAGTGEEGIRIVNGSVYKDKFDWLCDLNQKQGLLPKIDIRGESCNSDHCPFYQKGVPSFFIYTQGGIQAYHDISDKYDTLPLTEFEDYFKLMVQFFDSI